MGFGSVPSAPSGSSGGVVTDTEYLEMLNGIAINTMRGLETDGETVAQTVGNGYFTAFETEAAGAGNASTFVTDEWTSAFAGRKSVGSIDLSGGLTSTSVSALTLDGVTNLLSGAVTPFGSTTYDGAGDYYATNAAGGGDVLKINGAQTWCCEIYLTALPGAFEGILDSLAGPDGFRVEIASTNAVRILAANGASSVISDFQLTDPAHLNTWVKLVGTVAGIGASNALEIFVGTESVGLATGTAASGATVLSGNDFVIGSATADAGRDFTGDIRNVEIYSGVPTDPTLWVPGTTSSMTGQASAPTLVYQSVAGGGSNVQGIDFTTNGSPVRVSGGDQIIEAVVYDVNTNQADWGAISDSAGTSGTLTLTAAVVGYNNGLTPAITATSPVDLNATNVVVTAGGEPVSPATAAASVGSIDIAATAGQTVTAITVDGTDVLGSTVTQGSFVASDLLLHMDSSSFDDSGANDFAPTITASVAYDTTPGDFKFGTGAAHFTGGNILYPANAAWAFGTGDFDINFQLKYTAASGVTQVTLLGTLDTSVGSSGWHISYVKSSGILVFQAMFSGGWGYTYNSANIDATVSDGSFHHLKFSRFSGACRLFLDGALVTAGASGGSPTVNITNTNPLRIGTDASVTANATCWLDEVQIIKGSGEDAAFTAPITPYGGLVSDVAGVINDFQSNWVAITTAPGDTGTLTLTAAANGDNNGLATDGAGTSTFSAKVSTTGGALAVNTGYYISKIQTATASPSKMLVFGKQKVYRSNRSSQHKLLSLRLTGRWNYMDVDDNGYHWDNIWGVHLLRWNVDLRRRSSRDEPDG